MGNLSARAQRGRPGPSTVCPATDPIGYISSCILKRDYRRCKRFIKKGTWLKVVQHQIERIRGGEERDLRIMDLPLHLMFAISQNGMYDRTFLKFLRLMLDSGYDPDMPDDKGTVPLHAALMRVNFFSALASVRLLRRREVYTTKFVLALCESGADVNVHEDRSARTPLHLAARCDLSACVQVLLDYGADLEARDADGQTPLSLAAENASLDALRRLLDAGARADARSARGQTPLHRAVGGQPASHAERCVQLLLAGGAGAGDRDGAGDTPLHLAARCRAEGTVIHQLLLHQSDASALNERRRSALYEYLVAYSLPLPEPAAANASQLNLESLATYPGFSALLESTPRSPRMVRNEKGRILPLLYEDRLRPLLEQFQGADEPLSLRALCRHVIRTTVGIAPLVYFGDLVKFLGLPPPLEEYVCGERYRLVMRAPGLYLRIIRL